MGHAQRHHTDGRTLARDRHYHQVVNTFGNYAASNLTVGLLDRHDGHRTLAKGIAGLALGGVDRWDTRSKCRREVLVGHQVQAALFQYPEPG